MIVNDEYKIHVCGRKRSWPNFRYFTRTCREGLSKTVKSLVRIVGLEVATGTHSFPNMKLRNPR